ncbi:MAG: preprotein translocase subunit SecE [Candidatus Wildermuthbacteria bacterium RIFCSPHIGHO2_01_FULL_47_27]|uniref:Protein translocase subunit SecE n=1 Tax=Candidatus Wildermuthbacteria bacterium RIFCSPHIGHO2_02_FULL_47_17 TaxID=1802452 RepID=A0A1G2R902_9BACT|nr:MAG: preprotein translocase subunit SecE [Candidatus Wildermuthbacteria bacterium RIFCSPHIGHO2_01_FULL_47_27]OHA68839.1 MAG: preprotein translocase subunit SecE [Candidatus Wildermuthbacteria bacterium RIFCSPHIGHO2_02_FULL_47_17]OHA75561.1 MAG: preprotein translocase subunit SecE [Candidatus Wildermuthbacteria bacterium RIFCSPLOWO2_02_FULL_47_10]
MPLFDTVVVFLKEVHLEIKKVNWPTREDVWQYTVIVVVFSAAVALYLGGIDSVFTAILNRIIAR